MRCVCVHSILVVIIIVLDRVFSNAVYRFQCRGNYGNYSDNFIEAMSRGIGSIFTWGQIIRIIPIIL